MLQYPDYPLDGCYMVSKWQVSSMSIHNTCIILGIVIEFNWIQTEKSDVNSKKSPEIEPQRVARGLQCLYTLISLNKAQFW